MEEQMKEQTEQTELKKSLPKLNKSGNRRGLNNDHLFTSNSESQKKATASKKNRSPTGGIIQSVTKSSAITMGRNKRITPETQQMIREELTAVDKSGTPYIHRFIRSFLNEAKSDPNSQPARMLANALFKEDLLATLDGELNKQMAKDSEFLIYRIRNTLYDKQKEVFDDSFSNTIECICTRRAGKTELVARLLVRDAVRPPYITPNGKPLERNAIYLNRTFDNAVGQMGKPVTDLLNSFDIHYSGNPGSGKITLDNGNTITFGGYNNKGDIDKFRGFHYGLICIDEISHLRNPSVLMKETLEPALADYGYEGRIVLTGTPPRTKKCYAYEQWHNPNIKHYHWSFMDNPFIPNKEDIIERVCKQHGVTIDAPFIQREYYGNMEAFDEDAMVFRGFQTHNLTEKEIAATTWDRAYIGVDWGYDDAAAVVAAVVKGKEMKVIWNWSESRKSISEICSVVKEYNDKLLQLRLSRAPMIICDSNEKSAVYELYQTYKLSNAFCAYKYDRDMAIDQLAEWCRTATITIPNDESLNIYDEFESTLWKRDEETDEIEHEIDDEVLHPNSVFSLLYISRQFDYDVLGQNPVKTAKSILEGQE